MKKFLVFFAVFFLLINFSFALVQVEPNSAFGNWCPGDIDSVGLHISGLNNVFGFQFDLAYNQSLITILNVTEGAFLNRSGQDFTFWIAPVLSTPGIIRNAACSRTGVTGVSGEGEIAKVNFRLNNINSYPANVTFTLLNVKISDPASQPLGNPVLNGYFYIMNCSCTNGQTRGCADAHGCAGNQTCTSGSWSSCVSNLYYCDSNCDGTNECVITNCSTCVCTSGQTRNCTDARGCTGTQTCTNSAWGSCASPQYYCDTDCDGDSECSNTACPNCTECLEDWTCTTWSSCSNSRQTRTCTDDNACGTTEFKPAESQTCTSGGGSGGGGGGGGGGAFPPSCTEKWACGNWGLCQVDGMRKRTCVDSAKCGTTKSKLSEIESCNYTGNCMDGIMNSDETGVDCGGRCSKPCAAPIIAAPKLKITAEPIQGEILDKYVFSINVENTGETDADNLIVLVNKWSDKSQKIESLSPGMSEKQEFVLSLPANPDEQSVEIQVLRDNNVVLTQPVVVELSVPEFQVKVNKDEESGKLYDAVIVDNRDKPARELEVEFSINKDKETYLMESGKRLNVSQGEIFQSINYLSQSLPPGKYEINSVLYENGQQVGEATSFVVLEGKGGGFNVKNIFYLIILLIVGFSLYVFFMSFKKEKAGGEIKSTGRGEEPEEKTQEDEKKMIS